MNEDLQLVTHLNYYGISPWEIEVVYGLFNDRFKVDQDEFEETDSDFVSRLDLVIPLSFNEEFFKWFEFKRWEKVKAILKEMKRRRGGGRAMKINFSFEGDPTVRFVVDSDDHHAFNSAIEKIDFVLELIPYHLEPQKLPGEVTEVIYEFDPTVSRWKLKNAHVNEKKFVLVNSGWKAVI